MTFEEFVTKYLNKKNPATQMYWMIADIPGDQKRIQALLDFARDVNLQYVIKNNRPAPDSYLIAAWNESAMI